MSKPPPACPFCRADLRPHCNPEQPLPPGACDWHHCRICGVTLDLQSRRGYDKTGTPITEWPTIQPDIEPGSE